MRKLSLILLVGIFGLGFLAAAHAQEQGAADKKAQRDQLLKEQRSIVPKLTGMRRRLAKTNEDVKKLVAEIKDLQNQVGAKKKELDAKLREISPEYKELAVKRDEIRAKLDALKPPKKKRGGKRAKKGKAKGAQ